MTAQHALGRQWEDVAAEHPDAYGPPSGYEDERDPHGIHEAALHLAHATTDDPEAGNAWLHDGLEHGSYVKRHVPVSRIADAGHPVTNPRVRSALQGYRSGAAMPPPVLVARNGQYEVADGHHRTAALRADGRTRVQAYVMRSPHRSPYPTREW